MISQLFAQHIANEFPHQFTPRQQQAAEQIGEFLSDPRTEQAFILRGYAGTGKTSLVAAVVRVWQKLQRPVVLMAPTGRAAKVFSLHAGLPAYTVHKVIYRQQAFKGEDTRFDRGFNPHKDTLYIIDEASMVANIGGNTLFGTGMLMDDMVQYIYSGSGCRMMLVGDTAQLPPVGEDDSPALRPEVLKAYGLNVRMCQLTEVVRQAEASAVLKNATHLRMQISVFDGTTVEGAYAQDEEAYDAVNEEGMPLITVTKRSEVKVVPGDELIDCLEASYRNWGADDTIVVTRSNKRAIVYNNGIRNRIFDHEDILTRGDMVMAVKNNYFWTAKAQEQLPKGEILPIPFIANGDSAEIMHLRNQHSMHGFDFADATLRFHDYDDYEIDCRVLLNTLQSEAPALTQEESSRLYAAVHADYADIPNQRERMKAIRLDPYYNALQIKYGYAMTCHKAQGGQWHEVYIDQGYLPDDLDPVAYLRWLYTAFTRTSANLYLVNWPREQTHFQ
ncbi:MAG: AAA family ATPase [Bacteroidaceae bacterium]|nr:AAA family ATPase [Bacteroidaceae bacterium]